MTIREVTAEEAQAAFREMTGYDGSDCMADYLLIGSGGCPQCCKVCDQCSRRHDCLEGGKGHCMTDRFGSFSVNFWMIGWPYKVEPASRSWSKWRGWRMKVLCLSVAKGRCVACGKRPWNLFFRNTVIAWDRIRHWLYYRRVRKQVGF